ncbi:FAD-dependent oxidoreductase [Azospirillum sp. A29]|uniref:NAD(P)/FAD-dependent oxidoreductase n=1 Tax=Azospirillum sp. A29 TaxID=3160606 RepID=UPI00366AF7E9
MSRFLECDVAVIGGGLVGASIAFGLCRSGVRPLVLDGEDLDLRASRANFALVWVQGKGVGAPHYALWSRQSSLLWPQFAALLRDATGIDVALSQRGAFSFALSSAELDRWRTEMETIAGETAGAAAPYEILGHNELRDRLPAIGPDVVGAVFSPADGHVNSLRLLRALHAALKAGGADYRARHTVKDIEPLKAGFRLSGDWGTAVARRVVLAAGIGNGTLAPKVGLDVPLKRSKGQVLVTEKCAPFLRFASATIRQTDEGGVMIGDSEETASTSIAARADINAVLAQRAIRTFPLLANVNVVRSWAGFRVKTLDGLPVYEESASHPGAFAVACHSGVTLAASHALVLAPQIAAGALSSDLAVFDSRRFPRRSHVPQTA